MGLAHAHQMVGLMRGWLRVCAEMVGGGVSGTDVGLGKREVGRRRPVAGRHANVGVGLQRGRGAGTHVRAYGWTAVRAGGTVGGAHAGLVRWCTSVGMARKRAGVRAGWAGGHGRWIWRLT